MHKPKLSSKTPDDPILNSLIDSHDDLIQRPDERRFAVVEFIVTDRVFVTHGDAFARVQVVHLEEIVGADLEKVLKLRDHRFTERTGQKSVPTPDTPLEFPDLDEEDDGVE